MVLYYVNNANIMDNKVLVSCFMCKLSTSMRLGNVTPKSQWNFSGEITGKRWESLGKKRKSIKRKLMRGIFFLF